MDWREKAEKMRLMKTVETGMRKVTGPLDQMKES